jgi:hypothetical protein
VNRSRSSSGCEGGVVGDTLQVESCELPQDDRVVDEALSLLVALKLYRRLTTSIPNITSTGVEWRPSLPELG